MKIVFVGIHNKAGKTPLDSTTVSGKTIDGVIDLLKYKNCMKINIFNIDHFPHDHWKLSLVEEFKRKANLQPDDIAVLLGNVVQDTFPKDIVCKKVNAPHPSLQYAKIKRPDYIKDVAGRINKVLTGSIKY